MNRLFLLLFALLCYGTLAAGAPDPPAVHGPNQSDIERVQKELETIKLNISKLDVNNEKHSLNNKEKYFETSLTKIEIILALYGLVMTLIGILATTMLAIAGFLGYKNLKEIKEEVRKELSSKVQNAIETTMKSVSEKPLNEMNDRVKKLEDILDSQQVPTIPSADQEGQDTDKHSANLFEEEP